MAGRTKKARAAETLNAVRTRFLAHLGDDATPERVLLADRAAKLVVRIGALEREAERRHLTAAETDVLGEDRLTLAVLVCRLRIEPVARRAGDARYKTEQQDDATQARLTSRVWG